MTLEPIIQLEENIDRLEHTHKCETEYLYEGRRCQCGVADLRDAMNKYRGNVWLENRSE